MLLNTCTSHNRIESSSAGALCVSPPIDQLHDVGPREEVPQLYEARTHPANVRGQLAQQPRRQLPQPVVRHARQQRPQHLRPAVAAPSDDCVLPRPGKQDPQRCSPVWTHRDCGSLAPCEPDQHVIVD